MGWEAMKGFVWGLVFGLLLLSSVAVAQPVDLLTWNAATCPDGAGTVTWSALRPATGATAQPPHQVVQLPQASVTLDFTPPTPGRWLVTPHLSHTNGSTHVGTTVATGVEPAPPQPTVTPTPPQTGTAVYVRSGSTWYRWSGTDFTSVGQTEPVCPIASCPRGTTITEADGTVWAIVNGGEVHRNGVRATASAFGQELLYTGAASSTPTPTPPQTPTTIELKLDQIISLLQQPPPPPAPLTADGVVISLNSASVTVRYKRADFPAIVVGATVKAIK